MSSGYIGELMPWFIDLWRKGTSTEHILDGFSRAVVQSNPIQSNPHFIVLRVLEVCGHRVENNII